MDEDNRIETVRLMDSYNFDSPIKVTLLIEEDGPNVFSSVGLHTVTSSTPLNNVENKQNQLRSIKKPYEVNQRSTTKKLQRKNNSERLRNFAWHLLDPIVDNLTNITKFYNYNVITVNKRDHNFERIKSEYLFLKNYYFILSYSTAVTILLPLENDQHFIHCFVKRIIQTANQCSRHEITFERIHTLLRHLIHWTKNKKKCIETNCTIPNCPTLGFGPLDNLRLLSFNPTINSDIMNIGPEKNNSNAELTRSQSIHSFNPQSFHRIPRNDIQPIHPRQGNVNNDTHKILLYRGPPNRQVTISIDPQVLSNLNYQNTSQTGVQASETQANGNLDIPSLTRRKTNDDRNLENYDKEANSPYLYNDNYAATDTGDFFNTNTKRSSISRDSGCASPPYINSPELNVTFGPEEMTPIISHVTSTNPNAVNIRNGNCKVCGTITNNMCIDCYQQYYCSSTCQEIDWSTHWMLCKGKEH